MFFSRKHAVRAALEAALPLVARSNFFSCPRCGGYKFGTSIEDSWDSAVGHCHEPGCDFTWPRARDGVLGFVSVEEVAEAVRDSIRMLGGDA